MIDKHLRSLAQLVMRGRVNATIAALLGALVPLVTPTVVALVTLRKGAVEGTLILFVGLLPTVVTLSANNQAQFLFFMLSVSSLVSIYVSALALRQTQSLSLTLMLLLGFSVVTMLMIDRLASSSLGSLVESLAELAAEQAAAAGIDNPSTAINDTSLSGLLVASMIMLSGVCSIFLARWCQALLYNPGGFGDDFRQLRLTPVAAIACLGASLYFSVQGEAYFAWSFIFALPLILVTVAIVHAWAKSSPTKQRWLLIFYAAIVASGFLQWTNYLQIILMGIGFLDSWMDFRSRHSRPT